MLRQTIAAWSAAALLVGPSFASAATRGLASRGGQLILGADRLIPLIAYTAISEGSGQSNATQKSTSISLFGGIGLAQSFYNVPRLAFDYAVTDNLTIGGAVFAYFMLSATQWSGTWGSRWGPKSISPSEARPPRAPARQWTRRNSTSA